MRLAVELVRDTPGSPAKARVLAESSRLLVLAGQTDDGIATAREGYAIAEELGLVDVAARCLGNIATAHTFTGEFDDAVSSFERSIELALSVNSPEAARGYHNLATLQWSVGELGEAKESLDEAIRSAERFGSVRMTGASRCLLSWSRYYTREWDEALRGAEAIIAECDAGASMYFEYQARIVRARIGYAREQTRELVLEDIRRAAELGEAAKDPQALVQTLAHATVMFTYLDSADELRTTASRLTRVLAEGHGGPAQLGASEVAWLANEPKVRDAFRAGLSSANLSVRWRAPFEAVLEHDYVRAADLFSELGYIEEGIARLRAGERLLGEGRAEEAQDQLRKALAFWRPLGASRYVRQAEELLAEADLEVPA
jgi:tetratricopeptide (TPR) repeat protein